MNNSPIALIRLLARTGAPLILGGALMLASVTVSAAKAIDGPTLQPLADKAPALPLKHSFHKDTSGKNEGPFILTLKNVSKQPLTVVAALDLSVIVHNRAKSRTLPPQVIEAGKEWKIEDLAATDKVTLTAEGFEPLTLTVH